MSNNFKIVISATDNATKTVRKVNDSFSKMIRPMTELKRSAGALGRELGMGKIGKSLGGVMRSARGVASGIAKIAAPMAAITGVASVAGVAALATEWGHFGVQLTNAAAGMGMAASTLQSLQGAGKVAGVSADGLTGSLKSLGDTMEDALYGRNQSALMLLTKLGIGIHKTADGSIDAARGFKDLATAIASTKSAQVQGLIARQFGLEAALPLLRKGAKGIEEYQRKVYELGGVRSKQAIDTAAQFGLNLNYLGIAAQGLRSTIGDKLIPLFQPFVTKLTDWIAANRELIATRIGQFVEGFATWLGKVDFNNVLNGISSLITNISDTVKWLGGWKVAAIGVAVAMNGGLIAGVINLGVSLTSLTLTTVPAAVKGLMAIQLALRGSNIAAVGMLASVTGLLGKLGALGAAGAVGYGIGTILNFGINKAVQWGTGEDGATLGGKLYDWTHPDQGTGRTSGGAIRRVPLGIRSNNPMNLQPGGREAVFATPEEGLTAGIRNLVKNYQGLSLAALVHKYAPGNAPGNTPASEASYLADLSSKMGLAPNQVPNLNDAKSLAPLVSSVIRHENGQNPYDKGTIDNAVSHVLVEFKNAPPGTTAIAKTNNGTVVPMRINHNLPKLVTG